MPLIPASHADLLTGHPVSMATIGPDGFPQVTAVTARLLDDGLVHTSLNERRQKYKNLLANPRATLLAIDPAVRLRTLEVRAEVELIEDVGKEWSRAFMTPGFDFETVDGPARRFHVIFHPIKVNVLTPPT